MGVKASEWLGLGVGYDHLLELSEKDVEKVGHIIPRMEAALMK